MLPPPNDGTDLLDPELGGLTAGDEPVPLELPLADVPPLFDPGGAIGAALLLPAPVEPGLLTPFDPVATVCDTGAALVPGTGFAGSLYWV